MFSRYKNIHDNYVCAVATVQYHHINEGKFSLSLSPVSVSPLHRSFLL